jgi:hypothetical protein
MSSSTPNTTSATSGIIDAPLSSWGIFSAEASLVINEVVQSESAVCSLQRESEPKLMYRCGATTLMTYMLPSYQRERRFCAVF